MSELELSPPALVLTAPTPVPVVPQEDAVGAVPLDHAKQAELREKARVFAAELADMDVNSPAFNQKVTGITTMGERDIRSSSSISNRMLERPAARLGGGRGQPGDDAQNRVSNTLLDLRTTITELDPNRADLKGARKLLKFLPGGDKIDRYFAKYQSAQSHLNAIIKSLDSGQDDLRKDNASIDTEKANMWAAMGRLSEYNVLAEALDIEVTQKIAELKVLGRSRDSDVLVAVQGYLALDLVRRNNLELIKGVDRAQTTTIAALRTAVIVAQALARQRLVLEQVTALNETTSSLIERTSEQLRVQGTEINQLAASSTVDIGKLQAAFDNVFAAMDALDTFHAQAADSMAQTVTALQGQITRAKPYLERTRRGEITR